MSKVMKNSLIAIGIVVVVFMIIWFAYDIIKTEPVDVNSVSTNLADENSGLDNIINDLFDNVVINEQEDNFMANGQKVDIAQNNADNNKKNQKSEEKNKSDGSDVVSTGESMTSKQEKAIALVKKEWGGDDGVYFSNESIDSQGRYIVSVRDKGTTNSLAFFLVDVGKELVTKQ